MSYIRPDINGLSPLTSVVNKQLLKDVGDRTAPVFGVALHCTGSGVVTKALEHKADPLLFAVETYRKPDAYFAHYVVGFDGTIAQIADEHEKAQHIGFMPPQRDAFLSGTWETE